jgi:lipoate-protein ligase A
MGLDEALLESEEAPPTLRMYTWAPAALSLGYFQRWADVPACARAAAVVRRITGGGAIHHAGELTFSIAASLAHELYRGSLADSYRRVHAAIAASLVPFGIEAGERGPAEPLSDRPGTGMCFHRSAPLDLVWNGRKGAGSAQRRKGGRVLHHGSIKLAPDPLEPGTASVETQAGALEAAAYAPHLRAALERALGMRLASDVPTPDERARAARLAARYRDPDFVRRR